MARTKDLRWQAIEHRKSALAKLIRGVLDGVAFNQHFTCDGATSFSRLAHSAARASSQSGLGRTIGPAGSIIGSM